MSGRCVPPSGSTSGRSRRAPCSWMSPTGRELASAVSPFAHGVIEERLPDGGTPLPADWALQDPDDYVASMGAAVREVLRTSGVDPADVVGVGIDFTACTMLPTTADGTPLCRLPGARGRAPCLGQAVEAPRRPAGGGPDQRPRGGAGRAVAAAVWRPDLVRVVPGQVAPDPRRGARPSTRPRTGSSRPPTGSCGSSPGSRHATAAPRATRRSGRGATASPTPAFLGALDPRFADLVDSAHVARHPGHRRAGGRGDCGGRALDRAAPGHAGRHRQRRCPCVGARGGRHDARPAGGGHGHQHLPPRPERGRAGRARGACGVVEDGIIPGLFGHEAGQASVGDLFGWWVRTVAGGTAVTWVALHAAAGGATPPRFDRARPGLVALDWWNGNRSILVDAELTGPAHGRHARDAAGRCLPVAAGGDRVSAPASSSRPWRARACPSRASWRVAACRSRTGC